MEGKYYMQDPATLPKISCIVRARPPNDAELRKNDEQILEFVSNTTVLVKEYK